MIGSFEAQPSPHNEQADADAASVASPIFDFVLLFAGHWRQLTVIPLAIGLLALGIAFVIPPTFTSRTVFLPPQQQQSSAASALASLGALSGLAGAAVGIKSPIDQYVTLMQTAFVQDRIIDKFKLMEVYDEEFRSVTRKELSKNVRIAAGKKDGLITVEVDDEDRHRAAEIANQFVDELRNLTNQLALTEAQQRRVFFEGQLKLTRDSLANAQIALQASGFTPGALKAEPKAAAEGYAKMKAEVTSAEIRLGALRERLADTAPEVRQQMVLATALRSELTKLEGTVDSKNEVGYIGKYREYKYQETLYELFAKQFELARLDESREGSLIQVVDIARPADKKSSPKRALIAIVSTIVAFLALLILLGVKSLAKQILNDPLAARNWARVRSAIRNR